MRLGGEVDLNGGLHNGLYSGGNVVEAPMPIPDVFPDIETFDSTADQHTMVESCMKSFSISDSAEEKYFQMLSANFGWVQCMHPFLVCFRLDAE